MIEFEIEGKRGTFDGTTWDVPGDPKLVEALLWFGKRVPCGPGDPHPDLAIVEHVIRYYFKGRGRILSYPKQEPSGGPEGKLY